METHHRLAEERCLFWVLSQPVENGHAQCLFQPGSSGLDRLKQAFPSARDPRTRQRQDCRPSCAWSTGLEGLTERRQREVACSVFSHESKMSERPEEASEGKGMGLCGGGQVINSRPPFGQMI